MLPGRPRPLLLAAALLAVLAGGLDAVGDAIGIPALQAGGGRAAAAPAAATSAASAHSLSLHAQQQLGGQLSEPRARSLQQAGGTGSSAATDGGPRCPLLSREVLAARAHHNTVMLAVVSPGLAVLGRAAATRLGRVEKSPQLCFTPCLCRIYPIHPLVHAPNRPPPPPPPPPPPRYEQANDAQWDFASNWLHFTKKAGISYYVVAAADAPASERLAAAGEPCFEWIDEAIAGMGEEGLQHGMDGGGLDACVDAAEWGGPMLGQRRSGGDRAGVLGRQARRGA